MPAPSADPLASMPDTLAQAPQAPARFDSPTGEGTYWMANKAGHRLAVPYSSVGRAAKAGYALGDPDRGRFLKDSAADNNLPRLFPGLKLPEGVRITGMNPAGQPIFGPAGTVQGSAGSRFGSSLWGQLKAPVVAAYDATMEGPKTPEEAQFVMDEGRAALPIKRLLIDPQVAAYRKAKQEYAEGNPAQAAGWGLAALTPGIGPAAAQIGEQAGQQLGKGDYAGAMGTLAGAAAWEEAPKLGAKALRSEFVTKTLPRGTINRMIRTGVGDTRFGKDPVAAILNEGIVGNSLAEVGDRVTEKLHDVGQQIDAKARQYPNKTVDASGALRAMDDAMAAAKSNGPLYRQLERVRNDIASDWREKTLPNGRRVRERVGPRSMRMTPEQALKFKREIGDRVSWTNDPLKDGANPALGDAYRNVKDALNQAVPELTELNERYSNLVGAAKAIQRRIPVEERNAHWSLSDIALAGTGHIPIAIARHVAKGPWFRTRWAQAAHNIPGVVPEPGVIKSMPVVGAFQSQPQPEKKDTPASASPEAAPADDPLASMPDTLKASTSTGEEGASPLANAIANVGEGFGPPNAVATRANNPGSLELGDIGHGTIQAANGQQITVFGSRQEGWDRLQNQLNLIFSGKSGQYSPDMTLGEFGAKYSNGDPDYGARLAASLGVDPSTTLGELSGKATVPTPPATPPAATPFGASEGTRTAVTRVAPTPSALKAEAAQRKPTPPSNSPRAYSLVAYSPSGHQIGSNDGTTWFDVQTGQRVQ